MFASPATEFQSDSHRRPYETVSAPDQVPLYDLVPVKAPDGEPLDAYRGVRRRDTSEIVSVVSSRYQLVQHREVAQAVHAIGEAWQTPPKGPTAPKPATPTRPAPAPIAVPTRDPGRRPHDGSWTRVEARVAFSSLEEAEAVATPTFSFSIWENTSGLDDDSARRTGGPKRGGLAACGGG